MMTGCVTYTLHDAAVHISGNVEPSAHAETDDLTIKVYMNLAGAHDQFKKQGPLVLSIRPESSRFETSGRLKWCTKDGPLKRPKPESIIIEIVAPGQEPKELEFPISEEMMTRTISINLDDDTIRFE